MISSSKRHLAPANGGEVNMKAPRRGPDGQPAPQTDQEYAEVPMMLRAIISPREAGLIIGKAGKNIIELRDEMGVDVGVSKVVQGVHDRILTITGACDAISIAYCLVAHTLLGRAPVVPMGGVIQNNVTHPIKLLISHNQMGTIIGRQGLKIQHIQDVSAVCMVAHKEILPQSTERIVEIQGTPDGIQRAVWEICKCLVDDWERGTGTVLYNPAVHLGGSSAAPRRSTGGPSRDGSSRAPRIIRTGHGSDFTKGGPSPKTRRSDPGARTQGPPTDDEDENELETHSVPIPADMVGCVIGRGGSKIGQIRKSSGAQITIAKAPHGDTCNRMFTVSGTAKQYERALFQIYRHLEVEAERRKQSILSSEEAGEAVDR